MKRISTAVGCLLVSVSLASAGIVGSKHDLSASGPGVKTTAANSQICIFCHTPHNPRVPAPLWNRVIPTDIVVPPYTSPTLSEAARSASVGTSTVSLLCLSCHTQPLAELGQVLNSGALPNPMPMIDPNTTWANAGARWNDTTMARHHPVGFDYAAAQAEKSGSLRPVADVNAAVYGTTNTTASVFFGTGGVATLECASCHSVHDNTYPPFLRKTMVGQALCLACHTKN